MSEIRTIENERLRVQVSDHGAELVSVYDKKNDKEVIWYGTKEVWNRHAPVLFPVVGQSYKKRYQYRGEKYNITSHGFARDLEFELRKVGLNEIWHVLRANDDTRKVYPFEFELEIGHILEDNQVKVCYRIFNHDEKKMYFNIGAHPGFNIPMEDYNDYSIEFTGNDVLEYILLNEDGCAVRDKKYELVLDNSRLRLSDTLFEKDALIFENGQIDRVSIIRPDGSRYITMMCPAFPYFGLWSKVKAPFVCLEPWYGRCDNAFYEGELREKEGIQLIRPQSEFLADYAIEIN